MGIDIDDLYIKIGKYPDYSIMLFIPPQASIMQFIFQLILTIEQMLFSFSIPNSNFLLVKQFFSGWINDAVLGGFVAVVRITVYQQLATMLFQKDHLQKEKRQ